MVIFVRITKKTWSMQKILVIAFVPKSINIQYLYNYFMLLCGELLRIRETYTLHAHKIEGKIKKIIKKVVIVKSKENDQLV